MHEKEWIAQGEDINEDVGWSSDSRAINAAASDSELSIW